MERCLSVRKGAWTGQEDQLLRKCIQEYGEGKWHQIPERAGLNRCRKSCRLRWLNYLKPNIKRGEFSDDEVDMMIRLHKLLGNRWSLIAGRLPGRTANDVKNHWNTHLRKKMATSSSSRSDRRLPETLITTTPKLVTSSNIFKPRPRTFSKRFFPSGLDIRTNVCAIPQPSNSGPTNDDHTRKNLSTADTKSLQDNNSSSWWEDLLVTTRGGSSSQEQDECINFGGVFSEEIAAEHETNIIKGVTGFGPNNYWDDFSFDADIWSLLDAEERMVVGCPI